MRLPSPATASGVHALIEVAAAMSVPFRTAEIEIFDPEDFTIDKPYDAKTDTGGVKTYAVLWSGLARLVDRTVNDVKLAAEWGTKVAFQFDIGLEHDLPLFHAGYRIRVKGGSDDPAHATMVFVIRSAVDSSLSAQRVILATSDGAEVPVA